MMAISMRGYASLACYAANGWKVTEHTDDKILKFLHARAACNFYAVSEGERRTMP